ncbi:four-carbon acid sugar kinase family protein [Oceanobacillus jeddahense]|uniref:Four-carbon acid sugar kinase family protein n=1 Tax=Oceanobacillus jeddahense TaxID=1462527 RepID=A0ABY5JTD0_9BACI|nr:four-carbon acid sugar kinase family protein [Oceanobacillus jeddahense]UUI03049.1 four-carbon acid sugar kinase family protein [Oceanobacillus jeddahense]
MKERLLLAFYGDDFTGSTDAMEALTLYGLNTVLFLEVPDKEVLTEFENVQCIGVAGTSRAKSPEGMHKELQPIFEKIAEINPQFFHYKVCSTFDSSPETGSIGYAADLASNYFKNQQYHLLVGVPQLGRYTVFGNHFAKKDDSIYRLDRHPVVANHPVTPMSESDLKMHMSQQTDQKVGLIDILEVQGGQERIRKKNEELMDCDILLYDALEENHLDAFADYILSKQHPETQFLIGSSGVEYALGNAWGSLSADHVWEENNSLNDDRVLVVSGSVSAITSEQMAYAKKEGFYLEQIPSHYFGVDEIPHEFLKKVGKLIEAHHKVILYTADGPRDPAIAEMKEHLAKQGKEQEEFGSIIGQNLGLWTKEIMEENTVDKLIIAGGDTSGFVMKELGIYALKVLSSISPGAPLCTAYSRNNVFHKMKVALKGGQLGGKDFYNRIVHH